MSYNEQKEFFETAYRTGSDIWSDKLYHTKIFEYLQYLPDNSTVLDLGTGRGRWPFAMAEMGFQVIGLDYIDDLIEINNKEAKAKHFQGKLAFITGDALDIRFEDESFDVITDFGLLQHMHHEDWEQYGREISRVLKLGGYYLSVALSKETPKFYNFSPAAMEHADFEKYGVFYHFFTPDDFIKVLGPDFKMTKSETIFLPKHNETLLISLFRKM